MNNFILPKCIENIGRTEWSNNLLRINRNKILSKTGNHIDVNAKLQFH